MVNVGYNLQTMLFIVLHSKESQERLKKFKHL